MIGRRGPAQAKFTTKELRELGELQGADITVDPLEADLDAFDPTGESSRLAESDRRVRGNVAVIRDWAGRVPQGRPRRLSVRFWLRPVEIMGTERVTGLRLERTRLDESGRVVGTGEHEVLQVQMVLRSVGYQCRPVARCAVRRAQRHGAERRRAGARSRRESAPGEYVAGLAEARPDRRDRHQQVRRRADGPRAARRRRRRVTARRRIRDVDACWTCSPRGGYGR